MTHKFVSALVVLILASASAAAQPVDPALYGALRWRLIGPFRGGRTVGAAGVARQPNVFYIGVNNGGVWKTNDYGLTWTPIFDDQPTQSIGAIAVAPSDPNIIYVGSGEGLQRPDLSVGDGIYKSTDGGRSWQHLGLRDARQIGAIAVDPTNPNRLFVAALGHPYGPNDERGVFRSTDGGRTFERVLYKDENTGAIDLALDPANPQTVYAVLWAARQGPWEYNNAYEGPGSGLFVSADGGRTWRQLTNGLPTPADGLGRIGIAIAPNDSRRMYAWVTAARGGGIYRSDDAGATWQRVNEEARVSGRGDDFANLRVDPANKDIVYTANTSTYKSIDGGRTFTAIKGAPGGDDYHTIWINPDNPRIILIAADQGATISVNGGETWSSWYNQPTGQMFHVTADNRFPYWVYGGQQESGSAGVASRSDNGEITFREWHPVGVEEYGYAAPDPLHPGIIYGGKVTRYDEKTGQVQNVGPVVLRSSGKYRFDRTAPIIFSPADPHVLFFAAQVLFKTTDGGQRWTEISPDLTRGDPGVPPNLGIYAQPASEHRGVIYSVGPSPKDGNVIWVGSDDGLVHVTRDGGKTWKDVTPKELTPWSKVTQIDASHFDPLTAYISVSRFRLDDLTPLIFKTTDGGASWTRITNGLAPNAPVNVVREDPVERNLLYAGTERDLYVSFDEGASWQPITLNLPHSSMRDVIVKDDDLVVATHGRSFWILDDIAPLRELAGDVRRSSAARMPDRTRLYTPAAAWRVRHNLSTDTPLPPEIPAGQNPPDGAIIDYYLNDAASGPVVIEIASADGKLVRRYSSADAPPLIDEKELNVPTYWIRPAQIPSTERGMHRFVWDLHYPAPDAVEHEYPIAAIYKDTPRLPLGPTALPGTYTVRLTVNGRTMTQPLPVKMDPRIQTAAAGLRQQFMLATRVAEMMNKAYAAYHKVKSQESKADEAALLALNNDLTTVYGIIEEVDAAPTTQTVSAVAELEQRFSKLVGG
jgi:photosystem II stability/assembly factor-like uncharacterized protein